MAAPRRTPVGLETGKRLSFVWALDWPGWCRSGRDADAALEALAAYRPRYARVARRARLSLPAAAVADLEVVETVPGDASTDFGVPHAVAPSDHAPLDPAGTRRILALLDAAWTELEEVAAGAPASLRKGPRGGGRDRDAVVAHVAEAERAYGPKIGVRVTADEWRTGHVGLLRDRVGEALRHPDRVDSPASGWPPRYLVRRVVWHALDHAWEIEDRSD